MAIIGVCAGFVLDEVIARLAREPFEHPDAHATARDANSAPPSLDLGSEAGAIALPWSLEGGWLLRRAIVVALTALLLALVGRQYAGHPGAIAVVAAYVSVLLICAATDIIAYRVPNVVSYPAILAALAIGILAPGTDHTSVAFGGLMAGGIFLLCAILPGAPMGMGDVKLALFIGLALGFVLVVQAMLVMALAGGLVAALLLVLKVTGRRNITYMFYAPFISFGAIVILLSQGTVFFER
jgi:leader peptidase (prepilin peptidase)/N-methyltransferase